jgi:hypothetical protein
MTVLHTGATKKFVAGWENIFAGKGKKTAVAAETSVDKKKAAKKKAPAGKKPAKKSKGGKR